MRHDCEATRRWLTCSGIGRDLLFIILVAIAIRAIAHDDTAHKDQAVWSYAPPVQTDDETPGRTDAVAVELRGLFSVLWDATGEITKVPQYLITDTSGVTSVIDVSALDAINPWACNGQRVILGGDWSDGHTGLLDGNGSAALFLAATIELADAAAKTAMLSKDAGHAESDRFYEQQARIYPPFAMPKVANVAATDRDLYGEWSAVIDWPHIPVSVANLPDGRIMTWAARQRDWYPDYATEQTYTLIWNPDDGTFTEMVHPGHDMFCAHQVMLEDGRLFVNGGNRDVANTSIFDYTNNIWYEVDSMHRERWYPTTVALPNGDVFTALGRSGGQYPELWSPDTDDWLQMSGIDLQGPILDYADYYESYQWALLNVAPNGEIFHSGPTPDMHYIDPTGLGSITKVGPQITEWYPKHGTTVMYDEGKFLVAGGAISGTNQASTNKAMLIDITNTVPVLTPIAPMSYARKFHNGVMLPNGEVMVVGGNTSGIKFSDNGTILPPEIWNPQTQSWREVANIAVPRNYHSIALLLTDGRVLSGGGGLCGEDCGNVNHSDVQIYSPPYLFNTDGSPATRPEIESAPAHMSYGATVDVQASSDIQLFSLIKMSGTTHAINTDLRYLSVEFTDQGDGDYRLSIHSNPNVLTPGYYMLFAVNTQGVPSLAHIVQIGETARSPPPPPNLPPTISDVDDQINTVGDSVTLAISASDRNLDDVLGFQANGLPLGLDIDPLSGQISGNVTTVGDYNVTVTVSDPDGDSASTTFAWRVNATPSVGPPHLLSGSVKNLGSDWQTVTLPRAYTNLVVIAAAQYGSASLPAVVRIRNAAGNSFQMRVQNPGNAVLSGGYTIYYIALEAGVYTRAQHAITMEAIKFDATVTDHSNSWLGQSRLFGNAYSAPVVLGQVMTFNDSAWSVFWARGTSATNPPSTAAFFAGRHVGEDSNTTRTDETVAYLVVETGSGSLAPLTYQAGVGASSVAGIGNSPPYSYPLSISADHAVVAAAAMNDTNGGWPLLWGVAPLAGSEIDLAFDEDQLNDGERAHNAEQVAFLAFSGSNRAPGLTTPGNQTDLIGADVQLALSAGDPDGDALSFSASGLPAGLTINDVNGTISGTPTGTGVTTVTVTASDGSGNLARIRFSWTIVSPDAITLAPLSSPPQQVNTPVNYNAVASGGFNLQYRWHFGDGSGQTAASSSPAVSHTFTSAGRYVVTLTVSSQDGSQQLRQFTQVIHEALTAQRPAVSMSILYETRAGNDRVWNVNPDHHSVSVFDTVTHGKLAEIDVGNQPRSLALAPDGRIWISNKESATLSIIDPNSFSVVLTIDLPAASQPFGIAFNPVDAAAYVTLEATGKLLALNPVNGTIDGEVSVGPYPRHLSISDDGSRIYVSRFITPALPGEASATPQTTAGVAAISVIDSTSFSVVKTITLQHSQLSDSEHAGRGIPNYLGPMVISPDGLAAWVPSKQDNIVRGGLRDGRGLTHDSTVRSISSRIALAGETEDYPARVDHDDGGIASSAAFGRYGSHLFVALEGSREIAVIDPYSRSEIMRFGAGRAPQGIAVAADGLTLYMHNFMDRSVSVHDISALIDEGDLDPAAAAAVNTYSTVASERLSAPVLRGKQLFYDALDPRLALQKYISCASCHNDGAQDGRVWDFTASGEGLRNTIDLRGRAGMAHGPLHWSANFDEVQDFEGQIRGLSGGLGLMSDSDFHAGTRAAPLGDPKAGISSDLDALAAYVASLDSFTDSPYRNADGSLTGAGAAGRTLFSEHGCAGCHQGEHFSDSAPNNLHDVGTLKASSGQRLSGPLTGIDTPTLRGVWATAPYLHDGSAATLAAAVAAHDGVSLSASQMNQLVAYLLQIDGREPAPGSVNPQPPANEIFSSGFED